MESPSMYPTAADYANSNALDAKRDLQVLKEQVKLLINAVGNLKLRVKKLEGRLPER